MKVERMIRTAFEQPPEKRYFEDYKPGVVYEFAPATVSESDIVDFARRFDPQPYHADPALAASYPFGGVIASGWHTGALMMRSLVDNYLSSVATLPSPGVDELRWLRPVRAGDALRMRIHVLSTQRSKSKPDRGVVTTHIEMLNQSNDVIMTVKAINIFLCRNPQRDTTDRASASAASET